MREFLCHQPGPVLGDDLRQCRSLFKERNAASVAEISSDADSISVLVSDSLDDTIYNFQNTIRHPLPSGWPRGHRLAKRRADSRPNGSPSMGRTM